MTVAVIWSKPNCPFCVQAKELLEKSGIPFEERNIVESDMWTREMLLEAVPGAKTVPQIFMNDVLVGGFDDLKRYYEDHDMWKND